MSGPCAPLMPSYSLDSEQAAEATKPSLSQTIPTEKLELLYEQGFPRSLALSLEDSKRNFALRMWICDNSGSMHTADGHRLVAQSQQDRRLQTVRCTRWEELVDTMEYHAQLAELIEAPTRFRFLNHPGEHIGPRCFGVGGEPVDINSSDSGAGRYPQLCAYEVAQMLQRAQPLGCTPLTFHIGEIRQEIEEMAPVLRATGRRVVVVIATDGLPTNAVGCGGRQQERDFVESLRSLEGLPVWLVIRLCTDEAKVTDFYNGLDTELELSMDVIDDFIGEAQEVYKQNPWLNYGLPLHRMREMGHQERLLDLLDERPFTSMQVRDFCSLMFSARSEHEGLPDPSLDWDGFRNQLKQLLDNETKQWNSSKKTVLPWIDLKRLTRIHGPCTVSLVPPLWLIVLVFCIGIAWLGSIGEVLKRVFN